MRHVGSQLPNRGLSPLSPCIGRQSLNPWTTTEVPEPGFKGDTIIQQRARNSACCVTSGINCYPEVVSSSWALLLFWSVVFHLWPSLAELCGKALGFLFAILGIQGEKAHTPARGRGEPSPCTVRRRVTVWHATVNWVLCGVLSPGFTVLQVSLHALSLYVSPQILGLPAPSATFIHVYFFFAHKETHVQVITWKEGLKSTRLVTRGHCTAAGGWLGIGTKENIPIRCLLPKT